VLAHGTSTLRVLGVVWGRDRMARLPRGPTASARSKNGLFVRSFEHQNRITCVAMHRCSVVGLFRDRMLSPGQPLWVKKVPDGAQAGGILRRGPTSTVSSFRLGRGDELDDGRSIHERLAAPHQMPSMP
jgi:hypothetical protein